MSEKVQKLTPLWRALIEIAFIIFLFYSNLLMGEFTRSGLAQEKGLAWAVQNICTEYNFIIGIVSAVIGYLVFEFLRKRI